MPPRARPLTPDERRASLIDATLPLLLEHGRTVTTRQIADAAGVAEGTIFRVYDSKDELITAALDKAFDPGAVVVGLRSIEPDLPLRELVTRIVEVLQTRFRGVFELMARMGIVGPPTARKHLTTSRAEAEKAAVDLLTPYADQLSVPVAQFVHVTRLLTFSGSHPHLADGRTLSADEITTTVLDGLLVKDA